MTKNEKKNLKPLPHPANCGDEQLSSLGL